MTYVVEFMNKRSSIPVSNLIGPVFGGLWACAGSMALAGSWRVGMLVTSVLVCAVLLVRLMRDSARGVDQGRMFRRAPYLVAVLLEVSAIAVALAVLPRYGYGIYLLQVIGVIVGLHFLGLWQASHSRRMVAVAAAMCTVSTLSLLLPPSTANGVHPGDLCTGFGNALVLWASASRSEQPPLSDVLY